MFRNGGDLEIDVINGIPAGLITWQSSFVQDVYCELTYTAFPFDSLNIAIQLIWLDGEGLHRGSGLNVQNVSVLNFLEYIPDIGKFISPSSIWTYQNENVEERIKITNMNLKDYPMTIFNMPLVRKQEYYIWTIFIPLEMLMVLQLGTFIMPPDVFDRGTYSITVNLAFAVTQQVINGQMPKTSQRIYLS